MTEPIECAACMVQASHDAKSDSFDLDNWNLEGEFGVLCPKCDQEIGGSGDDVSGLEALAGTIGASKDEG